MEASQVRHLVIAVTEGESASYVIVARGDGVTEARIDEATAERVRQRLIEVTAAETEQEPVQGMSGQFHESWFGTVLDVVGRVGDSTWRNEIP